MNAIGQPDLRVDGLLKVTGGVVYTGDVSMPGTLNASIVHSTIASGKIVSFDTSVAERMPGVVKVFTTRSFPKAKFPVPWDHGRPHGQALMPLQADEVTYAGQPIALVVATTLDQAAHAGAEIKVVYDEKPARVFDSETIKGAYVPPQFLFPVTTSVGDADRGLAQGSVKITETYTTTDRHHNALEPHVTLASWGPSGELTLHETTQFVDGCQELVAMTLHMPKEKVRVISKFLGGGFGSKAWAWPHTIIAALAAKEVGKPVRLQLTRAQMYSMAGHQASTIQTIALAAQPDGKLTGIRHECVSPSSMFDGYIEYAAAASRSLWQASGGIATNHRIVNVNRNTPTPLRPPAEGVGHFAIESAMDELAYATGVDPVELRLRNDTMTDPLSGRPFSTRGIAKCLAEGSKKFGWSERNPKPRSMRHGRFLIGQGVACSAYTHWKVPSLATVTVNADGTALVESAMHDIRTGTYTVMRQIASDGLGIPVYKISVQLGDTRLPKSPPAFGSSTVPNAGASVMMAARQAREKLLKLAVSSQASGPLAGVDPNTIVMVDGRISHGRSGVGISIGKLLQQHGLKSVKGEGKYTPTDGEKGAKAVLSFSAVFAEVRIDQELGMVRLQRYVGAYDGGRIVNPNTARS